MKQYKFFWIAFGTLVVLNLVLLSMVVVGRKPFWDLHQNSGSINMEPGRNHPPHMEHGNPLEFISTELSLNDSQLKLFETEIDDFHSMAEQLMDEKTKLRQSLFIVSISQEQLSKILNQIAENEKALATLELNHFSNLKSNLTKDQQIKFDTLMVRMIKFRNLHPPMPGPPPPHI